MIFTRRIASAGDVDFIYSTKKESLYEYVESIWGWDEQFQRHHFNENLCLDRIKVLINSIGNRIGLLEIEESNDAINIVNIELVSTARNRGVGSILIDEIKKSAQMNGKSVILRVFKQNRDAIRFYRRHGFHVSGQSEHHLNMMIETGSSVSKHSGY